MLMKMLTQSNTQIRSIPVGKILYTGQYLNSNV